MNVKHLYTVDETDDTIKKVRVPKNIELREYNHGLILGYWKDVQGYWKGEISGYPTRALAIKALIRGNEIELEDYLGEVKSLYERIDRLKKALGRTKDRK